MNRCPVHFLILTVLVAFVSQAQPQDKIPIGGIVYNYVGHVYIDPTTGTGEVAGYFPSIAGIENAFADPSHPSEANAFFTYKSDRLQFTNLPADVDTGITILNSGNWHIYFNPSPSGNWSDPESFSHGQLIADLNHNALQLVSVGPGHQAVFSGELLTSYEFTYVNGKKFDFAKFFPDGITNFSSATNTIVPGGVPGFFVVFADAGWAVAKGHKGSPGD